MERSFDYVADVVTGRETWRIKVRVLRIWEVPEFLKPDEINSLEMVLINQKKNLMEGEVYKMSYFSVAPGFRAYRTTVHPYKLIFQMKTKVERAEGSLIPQYGLSLTKIGDVCSHSSDYDYLAV